MIISKELNAFIDAAKTKDSYWVEKAKLDYSMALEKQRKAAGFNYADIAKRIASSAAYITKVFRGDSNLTIESMVKLARAVGGNVEIRVVNAQAEAVLPAVTEWNGGMKFVLHNFNRNNTTTTASVVSVANEDFVASQEQLKAA